MQQGTPHGQQKRASQLSNSNSSSGRSGRPCNSGSSTRFWYCILSVYALPTFTCRGAAA
jgi:hypothetical protein